MEKITLEFDKDDLVKACVAFKESNDILNANVDADPWYLSELFADNDECRLWLAEMLYDAYIQEVR